MKDKEDHIKYLKKWLGRPTGGGDSTPLHRAIEDVLLELKDGWKQWNEEFAKRRAADKLVEDLKEEIRQSIITLAVSGNNVEAARLMQRMVVLVGDDCSGFKFNK